MKKDTKSGRFQVVPKSITAIPTWDRIAVCWMLNERIAIEGPAEWLDKDEA